MAVIDWSMIVQVTGTVGTGLLVLLGFVRASTRQESKIEQLSSKADDHARRMEIRMDKQDTLLNDTRDTLGGVRLDVARIKTKLDMNGH